MQSTKVSWVNAKKGTIQKSSKYRCFGSFDAFSQRSHRCRGIRGALNDFAAVATAPVLLLLRATTTSVECPFQHQILDGFSSSVPFLRRLLIFPVAYI